jgi:hypothetical protein
MEARGSRVKRSRRPKGALESRAGAQIRRRPRPPSTSRRTEHWPLDQGQCSEATNGHGLRPPKIQRTDADRQSGASRRNLWTTRPLWTTRQGPPVFNATGTHRQSHDEQLRTPQTCAQPPHLWTTPKGAPEFNATHTHRRTRSERLRTSSAAVGQRDPEDRFCPPAVAPAHGQRAP